MNEFIFRNLIKDQRLGAFLQILRAAERYPAWLPEKCSTLYRHPRLVCSEPEDELTELFRRRLPWSQRSKEAILDIAPRLPRPKHIIVRDA